MRHPIVRFLLARYNEEDPDTPHLPELRDQLGELECNLIVGGELTANPDADPTLTKTDIALAGLKVAAFRYRDHPEYDDDWRLPFDHERRSPTA
ncbi:hypothetical protein ACPESV_24515 [Streptomyces umbrinus]|uniref:hypothetical protein n=1 Tax=Streptomyces umbrinus TaxID=67370 RepID=UPI003C2B44F2